MIWTEQKTEWLHGTTDHFCLSENKNVSHTVFPTWSIDKMNSMIFCINVINNTQVAGTYQEDSDKCSHLSDPYMSLHLDTAGTNNHLHSPSRSFLQDKEEAVTMNM